MKVLPPVFLGSCNEPAKQLHASPLELVSSKEDKAKYGLSMKPKSLRRLHLLHSEGLIMTPRHLREEAVHRCHIIGRMSTIRGTTMKGIFRRLTEPHPPLKLEYLHLDRKARPYDFLNNDDAGTAACGP